MKVTTLNKIDSAMTYIQSKKVKFELNPLDVGIAEIQFKLKSTLEKLVPENGDFSQITEKFISKSPDLNISEIKVLCSYIKDNSPKKNKRNIELHITDKAGLNTYRFILAQGDKKDIIETVNNKKFFETCKKTALYINKNMNKV